MVYNWEKVIKLLYRRAALVFSRLNADPVLRIIKNSEVLGLVEDPGNVLPVPLSACETIYWEQEALVH